MDDIINLLKENHKMTSNQISVSLKRTAREVIADLINLEKNNKVMQLNGFWSVYTIPVQITMLPVETLDTIKQWNSISVAEVSLITGASPRSVARELSKYVKSGMMSRHRKDGTYFYTMKSVATHDAYQNIKPQG